MWRIFAIISAIFAALTSIFAKLGMKGIDSNLATAMRTAVVLILAWGIVFAGGQYKAIHSLTHTNWLFIILSGLATGLSWLFYFRAIQLGDVSQVAPIDKASVILTMVFSFIILQEKITLSKIVGGILIGAGSIVLIF